MTKKFKWFCIKPFTEKHFKRLTVSLSKLPYTEAKGIGFIVDELRNNYIESRFIERTELLETVQNPLGGQIEYKRVTYNQCAFKISLDWPVCEITDGFRLTTKLFNTLALELNLEISIEEEKLSLVNFSKLLRSDVTNACITSVVISNLQIDGQTSAKVEISSSSNASQRIKELSQGRSFDLTQIKCNWISNGQGVSISLTHDGRAVISALDHNAACKELRSLVRKSIIST